MLVRCAMTRIALGEVTRGWAPRAVASSENPGLLEQCNWPLLHRSAQLAAVVEATRRVLATHAPPGSGKTRFLRTMTLPADQIASFMVGSGAVDGIVSKKYDF